ncbi:transglutaminase TgpA family protein [Halobacillus karajensis]|uniref:Protein-glutamine gamma-glutamyltransferase n=1 Tax=Halobacillus karajensis TaxID=195088 RepID=A0A024P5G4_9BACI|nr:transglutaminaseTgpA domain-containing protein [Halobacillus karajensis]CDQ20634.1 Protein-glutamine gamma-glutamyltransferase [Halobacillus karajensis]CDQ23896.1 Protein-glutamine gamma-glutamyltransferase [Halobacillus karajensis]CDQ27374.1 Protein-glutamine gamma-glutamyltransferase [Halobacillus karajensis]
MEERQLFIYKLVLYVTGFLLFCEWLRPLETISHTEDAKIFFIYAVFCFFVSFLQVPWYISILLKGMALAFIMDGLYIAERIFSGAWFSVFYEQIIFNTQMIQFQEWWQMTPLFRSLLFLILLWLMSYLLYYWFVIARRMFFFVLLTLIYVTVVDTFTVFDGKWSIIRTFVIGMIALGLSSFAREMDKESIPLKGLHKARVWTIPLIAVILLSSAAAYASPKFDPQWPDPVPYLESAAGGAGPGGSRNGTVQKVGYGEDDSRLGGSFIQDDTPVFEAVADGERYWRIESKDTYTGKGWEDTLDESVTNMDPENITFETFSEEVEVEEQTAFITMERQALFKKLVYPYGLSSLVRFPSDYELLVHVHTGEMDTVKGGSPAKLGEFVANYEFPTFEYNQLREAGDDDPQEIRDRYLQLPESLPNRVRNLASQIVGEEDNRYDRVKAVESYFSSNGFEYSTTDVPVPDENDDYVDQFLFESQLGYCDNFSTSMVILLRSEGIPARWVKGFTGGERIDTREFNDNVQNVYQVTSGNAHSWVEVYFPEVGWVPFEPTKGFTNTTDFYTDVDTQDSEDSAATPEDGGISEDNLGNPQQMDGEEQSSDQAGAGSSDQHNTWIVVLSVGFLIIAVILFVTRYRWMSMFLIRKYRKNSDEQTYEKAYLYLLKVLDYKGFKRKPEQTLRDFARTVDQHYQSNDMRRLTDDYERVVYGNESQRTQWPKVTELWEDLIKKTLS